MRLKGLKKLLVRGLGAVLGFVLIIFCLCIFFGIRTKMDVMSYYYMIQEDFHPIWKDLALRRINKGDSIESVLHKYTPLMRMDFPPYVILCFEEPFSSLSIVVKNGKLICAASGSCCWEHIFFDTPEEDEQLDTAYSAYIKLALFENKVYRLHLAKTNGQDVFISRQIKRSDVPAKELSKKYNVPVSTDNELTVEITKVVYGNLKEADIISFPGDECRESEMNEPETVFLCFDDSKIIYNTSTSYKVFTTVPKKALDWYQSLSEEQIKEFEARVLARRPKW
jgi:hypothetical protein